MGFIAANTAVGMVLGIPFGWLGSRDPEAGVPVRLLAAALCLPVLFSIYIVTAFQAGLLPGSPFPGACGRTGEDPTWSILGFCIAYPVGVLSGWRWKCGRRRQGGHVRGRYSSKGMKRAR